MNTKSEALETFEATRKEFLEKCRAIARRAAYQNPFREATIDDVRSEVSLPEGMDGRVFGAVFNRDEWEAVGFVKSTQKINHGRPITRFRLKSTAPIQPIKLPSPFPEKPKVEAQPGQLF